MPEEIALRVRPLEPDDIAPVAALLDTSLPYDDVSPDWAREKTFADPDYDGDLALVATADGIPVAVAQGIVRPGTVRPTGCVKWFATAEGFRGRGIATRLLDRIEEAMRARGVRRVNIAALPPNYVMPGLDPRYTEAYVFLECRGYRRVGEAFNMTCDLAARDWDTARAEADLATNGIVVRRALRTDEQSVFAFVRGCFPNWLREVAACFLRSPISLHIALDDRESPGRVVGFAAYDANNVGKAWFGPMGTDPAFRGHGIGKILLHRCLADQRAQGYAESTIPWVGPLAFYWRHCDAVVSRVFWQVEKTLE